MMWQNGVIIFCLQALPHGSLTFETKKSLDQILIDAQFSQKMWVNVSVMLQHAVFHTCIFLKKYLVVEI